MPIITENSYNQPQASIDDLSNDDRLVIEGEDQAKDIISDNSSEAENNTEWPMVGQDTNILQEGEILPNINIYIERNTEQPTMSDEMIIQQNVDDKYSNQQVMKSNKNIDVSSAISLDENESDTIEEDYLEQQKPLREITDERNKSSLKDFSSVENVSEDEMEIELMNIDDDYDEHENIKADTNIYNGNQDDRESNKIETPDSGVEKLEKDDKEEKSHNIIRKPLEMANDVIVIISYIFSMFINTV